MKSCQSNGDVVIAPFGGTHLSQHNEILFSRYSKKCKALTFDEVTLSDRPVEFHPNDVKLSTYITRNIKLKGCGIVSAAMDTVTEKELALAMAKMGGMGILHRNLSPKEQCDMLRWVRYKIHDGGMIEKPITFLPKQRASVLQRAIKDHGWTFTSFPVVDEDGKLLGLLTRDEMEFVESKNPLLSEIMLGLDKIVTAPFGTGTDQAYDIMKKSKVKKLPVVDDNNLLKGMYVWNDVKSDQRKRDLFSIDSDGHFLIGAAIGLGEEDLDRAKMLVEAGCKVLVMDSSHGSCLPLKNQLKKLRELFGNKVDIIAGNIASYESAMYLLKGDAKPDALKVGIGPGSICTTRQVTGHGIPQVTALYECHRAVAEFGKETDYYVPLIADGGIRTSGDIVKCLAAGASSIMLGSALAGTTESPGKMVIKNGKRFKTIRGMGSRSAMEDRSGSRGRYYRDNEDEKCETLTTQQAQKMVPEGVEGLVEFKGNVEKVMTQLRGGIQAGLAHSGGIDVEAFQSLAQFWVQSFAGTAEGKPHDITDIVK